MRSQPYCSVSPSNVRHWALQWLLHAELLTTGRRRTCRLGGEEFMRRFLQHVLPRNWRSHRLIQPRRSRHRLNRGLVPIVTADG